MTESISNDHITFEYKNYFYTMTKDQLIKNDLFVLPAANALELIKMLIDKNQKQQSIEIFKDKCV